MLTNDISSKQLFCDVKDLIDASGLKLVDVSCTESQGTVQMKIVLYCSDHEINTDDLEIAYNIIYPRYSVLLGARDLTLEVTSPGLQRTFKDFYEFSVFTGKNVRLYSTRYSCYVIGRIKNAEDNSVVLSDYLIEDKNEKGEELVVPFCDIAKAKLEYRWEGRNA